MKKYTVREDGTLKKFTDSVCPQASFYWNALLSRKDIRINGKKTGSDVPVKAGDEVTYYLTPSQEERRGFSVVYSDDEVAVVDKESGVNSEAVYSELLTLGEYYFIHRLDRNTAGLMIFAKTKRAEELLLECFRLRKVEKVYEALVVGKMPKKSDVLRAYLVKDEKSASVRISARPKGEKIVTEYEVLSYDGECSLLKVVLHTGKTHQIRAHMAFIGHPVAGDEKYGDGSFNKAHKIARQRLVAKSLVVNCAELPLIDGRVFYSTRKATI